MSNFARYARMAQRMSNPQAQQAAPDPYAPIKRAIRQRQTPQQLLGQMDPQQAQIASQIIGGKSEEQLRTVAQNMARQRGVDLKALAYQLGVELPQ